MKPKQVARALALEERLASGERLRGRDWRAYRRTVTRMRRERGIETAGHAVAGNQRVAQGPPLAAFDREGHLVALGQGRRGRR